MPITAHKDRYKNFVEISTRERDKEKLRRNNYFVVGECELQTFQDCLLEGLAGTLIERSKDGNLVSNVSFIYHNMQDDLEKWVK